MADDGYEYVYKEGKWYRESIFFADSSEVDEKDVPKYLQKQTNKLEKPRQIEEQREQPGNVNRLQQKPNYLPPKANNFVRQVIIDEEEPCDSGWRQKLCSSMQKPAVQYQCSKLKRNNGFYKNVSSVNAIKKILQKRTGPRLQKQGYKEVRKHFRLPADKEGRLAHSNAALKKQNLPMKKKISRQDSEDIRAQLHVSTSSDNEEENNDNESVQKLREGVDYSFQLPEREHIPITLDGQRRMDNVDNRYKKHYKIYDEIAKELNRIESEDSKLREVFKPPNARIDAPISFLESNDILFPNPEGTSGDILYAFCAKHRLFPSNIDRLLLTNSKRRVHFNDDNQCAYCKAHANIVLKKTMEGLANEERQHECPYLQCNCTACRVVDIDAD